MSSRPKFGHCLVRDWGTHPATHRTGYCEHHHVEFALVKGRWRSATNNFRRGASLIDPGPWADYFAAKASFTERDMPRPTVPVDYPQVTNTQQIRQDGAAAPSGSDSADPNGLVVDPDTSLKLKGLADALDSSLERFQERAFNLDEAKFTRTWAAEVEDRVEYMKAAAANLRTLSRGEMPSGPWPRDRR